jgi:hypothetical protein
MKLKGIPIKGVKPTKSGKLEAVQQYRNVSQKIAAKKSKKVRVIRKTI